MVENGLPSVLVVEDDDAVRGFLIYALESGGHAAIGARTGEEAISALRAAPIGVILIDGILPDMHGIRLARAILDDAAFEDVAITFVTGAIRDRRSAVAGIGALNKPLRARDLNDAVDVLLRWRADGGSPIADRRSALARLEHIFLVGA
ncbi:MAG: PleD family two-component system response regulator [Candidatus Dormibacteria bacterium]